MKSMVFIDYQNFNISIKDFFSSIKKNRLMLIFPLWREN